MASLYILTEICIECHIMPLSCVTKFIDHYSALLSMIFISMQGFLKSDPAAPRLDPSNCLTLAFPPTPLLQTPTHADACRPWVNLGQQVSLPPTQSLTETKRLKVPVGFSQIATHRQVTPFSSSQAASQPQAGPSNTDQSLAPPAAQPLQTLFTFRPKGTMGSSEREPTKGPAALRFYLLAELQQTAESASWRCYLITCSGTFRGVVKQVGSTSIVQLSSSWHCYLISCSCTFQGVVREVTNAGCTTTVRAALLLVDSL